MSRWVYWVALLSIAGILAGPVYHLLTDPQAELRDLFRLGIDLQGGTSLVYELHAAEGAGIPDPSAARDVILQRIDPQGTRGYIVRPVGKRLEIILPGRSKVTAAEETPTKERLAAAAQAASRQKNPAVADLLNEKADAFTAGTRLRVMMNPPMYLDDMQTRLTQAARERMPDQRVGIAVVGLVEVSGGQWKEAAVMLTVPAAETQRVGEWKHLVTSALSAQRDVTSVKRLVKQAGFLEFRILADRIKDRDKANFDRLVKLKQEGKPTDDPRYRWYPVKRGWEWYRSPHGNLLDAWNMVYVVDPESRTVEALVNVADGQDVTGRDLARAYASVADGEPVVSFGMKPQAAQRFARLTSPEVRGRQLGILLDGIIQSAPALRATLSTGGIIEGYKGQRELEEVVTVLNSGQLAASLGDPVLERTVGPELGEDNIHKGKVASIVGFVLVVAFMAGYYLFAGLVANVALVLNLVLTVCLMYVIRQTWTLPGIAGLILSLAMAVDANVLVNERLREEKGKEGSLGFALKKAYERALRTILDSNLTTLIPAFILLVPGLATEEVKGFAIVMIIGILVSMFTAVVVTRMIFETVIGRGWVKQVKMLQVIKVPDFEWMRVGRVCLYVSAALAVAGIIAFWTRGEDKYDIEFTGGTQVELALKAPAGQPEASIGEVRRRATDVLGGSATVQELEYAAETGQARLSRFLISVPAEGALVSGEAAVKAALAAAFEDMRPEGADIKVQASAAEITEESIRQRLAGEQGGAAPAAPAGAAPAPAGAPAGAAAASAEAPPAEATAARYIPRELRQFLGKIVVTAEVSPPLAAGEVQRRLDTFIRDRYPDAAGALARVEGRTAGGSPGEFRSFDLWVRDDFAGLRGETPAPQFWADAVKAGLGLEEPFASTTSFEPTMAGETWHKAVVAIILSIAGIIIYIWARFAKLAYGLAAVVALVYDVLVTLGAVAVSAFLAQTILGDVLLITDMRINLAMVGAFLTLVGYSINDKIVIFDRIRENRGKFGNLSVELVDRSLNQTLSRTIWTGFTTLMVLLVIYVFAGQTSTLHGFSFVLFFGILMGTYSSLMVACPILVMRREARRAPQMPGARKR